MGLAIPSDLKAVLAIANGAAAFAEGVFYPGAGFLPGGYRLLSVPEIVEQRQMNNQILSTTDEEMVGFWWHPQWLPVAQHVRADALVIDLRPGSNCGAVGEFAHDERTEFGGWGSSFAEFIARTADSIENAVNFRDYCPLVVDGALDWDDSIEYEPSE